MLGLQGSASAPKVYRCVACSDTFPGLASLLVHQASHASTLSKSSSSPQTQPNTIPQESLFASTVSAKEQASPAAPLVESPSPSFYICDCGEEFQDFSLMLEHKRLHVSEMQQLQPLDGNIALSSGAECNNAFPNQQASFTPVTQTGLGHSRSSTSLSPALEVSTSNSNTADVALEDHVAMVTPPQGQCTPPPQDISMEQTENMPSAEDMPESEEDRDSPDKTNSVQHTTKGENLPKNDTLMKLLASAYKNRYPPPLSESQSENRVVPKQEATRVEITPVAKPQASSINDLSIAQLRRLLAKPGIKTKAPSISKILESSRKRVVSLTKTLSPVVVLETRQKLMDSSCKGTYGRYQCGRCRRVFQNIDRLTEHHFLHKKERIKCCRRCKQLIIGRLPLPDNHVCPQMGNRSIQPSSSFKTKLPFAPKIVPFHSMNNAKKVFFCPLCKNSYARRWNLKTHRCIGQMSLLSRQGNPTMRMLTLRSNHPKVSTDQDKNECQSIAVGTEITSHIKVETNSEESAVSPLAWTPPAKSFSPFFVPSPMMEPYQELSVASLQEGEGEEGEGEVDSWGTKGLDDEDGKEGQWTMPLDDETHVFNFFNKADDDEQAKQSGSVEHVEMTPHSLRYFVSNGVRRYPCNRCQKTYSRASTLRRHLRLCGFRPRGFGAVAQTPVQGAITQNSTFAKPMFSCFVCGRMFNRKDNMMTHRKRCQFKRTMSDAQRVSMQPRVAGSAAADGQPQGDDTGNWGIMSLPSVLPRRVTCECGVGFTSPRLLLEHLQKHAQESYTCPTCGETVNSWADYEVHLQIHMHPHHQLIKGLQPSPPLLVRIQQPQQQAAQPVLQSGQTIVQSAQPVVQSTHPVLQPPQKQPRPELPPHPSKKQRTVCTRCGNSFASRCSLRRHISWNRCKGVRAAANPPKTFNCSHCNADFPNSISLLFHQRNGACKPAIKPVRCPVCLRWFGTMDSLQKHLLTHKQSESYRCDVCQGTYPSLKSLKIHRRRIHRILIGNPRPKTQEPLTF
ncbi:zinc finger protein 836 [Kryptolebias marmoratus]|uniref:zinc finger protein 836 n=1 Tax=Kryptolebias marmoratus TaxID=37003 RepID=UPI0007F89413|nr:zinc finger protein 836 [Kryptolebias marmoratus]XP_024865649.1 zinc finger protein 836 [Kryptolebias marmoratus]XP_037836355.1 zinc finger protein 836 [Kryptolebias marmoratus]